ncbi:hypothetical protein O181_046531 [Austropuccinia psidii MF-1]|uniref:Uncharacterized protein n=1 Tax=Austropuccinia psidii MF-1 TaxID=1389203 RepID=A0A9Q3HIQ3_9BASI|nr:hypothetical protein [Austropuccinia psidii MF-1]
MEPEIRYSDPLRLMMTGNPTRLSSGFKPLRHQQISDQESSYFPIQDRIQERKRIIEIVGPVARSTKKQQTVVNTSNAASSPMIRNDISTQMKHNVVIPESTIRSNTLWLQFSQFVEQTQKEFERLHESISRLQEVYTSPTKTIHTLQEDYTKLYKASEDTKRRLNQVLEEQNYCKRDGEYLDQDIDKLFNYFQKMKPQTQGNVLDDQNHQQDIKPDAMLEKKPRSQSQYQYGDKMTYSEKE